MQLLVACGLDADERVVPCAWALVLAEDEENWTWFMYFLRDAFLQESGYLDNRKLVVMSDRDKGLMAAVEKVLPKARPAHCCQHIATNIQSRFGISCVPYFWKCARARTRELFDTAFEALQDHNLTASEYVVAIPLQTWARSFFQVPRYGHDTNNITESLNASWESHRHLSPLRMLDAIWLQTMTTVYTRAHEPSINGTSLLAPKPLERFRERRHISRYYRIYSSTAHLHQIEKSDSTTRQTVNLRDKTCTCTNFQEFQSPCTHALAACANTYESSTPYVSKHYFLKCLRETYAIHLPPVSLDNLEFSDIVKPPQFRKQKGRPKKQRYRRRESTVKKQCSTCGHHGHNRRSCRNQPQNSRPRQLHHEEATTAQSSEQQEGPNSPFSESVRDDTSEEDDPFAVSDDEQEADNDDECKGEAGDGVEDEGEGVSENDNGNEGSGEGEGESVQGADRESRNWYMGITKTVGDPAAIPEILPYRTRSGRARVA